MPLFMDRHDLPGTTAEMLAQAHLTDLQTQAKYDVQFLAYWFDADNGAVFCLAKAPQPEAMTAVHAEAHGLVANEIIRVSEDSVVQFLGKIVDPASDNSTAKSPFRTILFTDIEESTALLQEIGQSAYMTHLAEHDTIIRRALIATHGREVKHTGDGIMASFEDVAGGLACALALQEAFDTRNAAGGKPDLRVRIGMASGEPVDHNDDIFGSTVHLASRICGIADAGHPLASELLRDLGLEKGFSFHSGREVALKGFVEPARVFELAGGPS
jgi:class 3 adenylate cyclase